MDDINVSPTVRRVSTGELARLMGYSTKWLRDLELAGRIPPAQRDPWSRRKFWPSDQVEAIIRGSAPPRASATASVCAPQPRTGGLA